MATPRDKYFENILDTPVDNDHHNAPLSNGNLRQAIIQVMEETEEEKCNIILDANNVTINNFCQSPVTTNKQRKNTNTIFTSERRITLDILEETIKGLTLDLTINDSVYYNSDKDDAEIDPKRDPKVATHTSDGKKIKVTDTDTNNGNYSQIIDQPYPPNHHHAV